MQIGLVDRVLDAIALAGSCRDRSPNILFPAPIHSAPGGVRRQNLQACRRPRHHQLLAAFRSTGQSVLLMVRSSRGTDDRPD